MKASLMKYSLGCIAILSSISVCIADQPSDRQAIQQAIDSYTAAFSEGDAAALAGHWSTDAVYTNPLTGEQVTGREAITQQFTEVLAQMNGAKLAVDVESIEFLSPSVAMEKGTASVVTESGEPELSRYTAIHVKHNGKWLLDRVSEEEAAAPSNYEKLRGLEWMIGTWVDKDDQARVETECRWTKNQSFITRTFTISVDDRIDMSGMQIIGWDANANKVRSWVFDSDGGFGEATWRKDTDRWVIEAAATLPDGRRTSAINIMTVEDADAFTWQSIGREIDGEILPNIDPVKVVRAVTADGQ